MGVRGGGGMRGAEAISCSQGMLPGLLLDRKSRSHQLLARPTR